jgi:hypothetical protein
MNAHTIGSTNCMCIHEIKIKRLFFLLHSDFLIILYISLLKHYKGPKFQQLPCSNKTVTIQITYFSLNQIRHKQFCTFILYFVYNYYSRLVSKQIKICSQSLNYTIIEVSTLTLYVIQNILFNITAGGWKNPSVKSILKYYIFIYSSKVESFNLFNATYEISRSELAPLFRIYSVFENITEINVSQHLSAVKSIRGF